MSKKPKPPKHRNPIAAFLLRERPKQVIPDKRLKLKEKACKDDET